MRFSSHLTILFTISLGWLSLAGCFQNIDDLRSNPEPPAAGQGGSGNQTAGAAGQSGGMAGAAAGGISGQNGGMAGTTEGGAAGGQGGEGPKGQRVIGTIDPNPVWHRIGVYRASMRLFVLDTNANDVYDYDDRPIFDFIIANPEAFPVAGAWRPPTEPYDQIGLYANGLWSLDVDGNEAWDVAKGDIELTYGTTNSVPLTGDWDGDKVTDLGYVSQGVIHRAFLRQTSNNGLLVEVDPVLLPDIPLPPGFLYATSGDWRGSGVSQLAIKDGQGNWRIDLNGDGVFEACPSDHDACATWGNASHRPLAAIWTDTGRASIGSFIQNHNWNQDGRIDWYFDLNGDFTLSGCAVDKCIDGSTSYSFGDGDDLPLVGHWRRTLPAAP